MIDLEDFAFGDVGKVNVSRSIDRGGLGELMALADQLPVFFRQEHLRERHVL